MINNQAKILLSSLHRIITQCFFLFFVFSCGDVQALYFFLSKINVKYYLLGEEVVEEVDEEKKKIQNSAAAENSRTG